MVSCHENCYQNKGTQRDREREKERVSGTRFKKEKQKNSTKITCQPFISYNYSHLVSSVFYITTTFLLYLQKFALVSAANTNSNCKNIH